MIEIPLTQGKVAMIDNEDFDRVRRHRWQYWSRRNGVGGCATTKITCGDKEKTIYMHRLILEAPSGLTVDHINGNGLDNRKENLRLATRGQNARNSGRSRRNTSGYKGVIRYGERWQAKIKADGKKYHLGTFINKEDAARAYDTAARKYFREFARTNFPDSEQ